MRLLPILFLASSVDAEVPGANETNHEEKVPEPKALTQPASTEDPLRMYFENKEKLNSIQKQIFDLQQNQQQTKKTERKLSKDVATASSGKIVMEVTTELPQSAKKNATHWLELYSTLVQHAHLSEKEVRAYIKKRERLNSIQRRIFGLKEITNDELPTSEVQTPRKPDESPYLFEGDILLNEEQMNIILKNAEDQLWTVSGSKASRSIRSLTSDLVARWDFPIPYYINTASRVNEAIVLAGIAAWESLTCVRFQRIYTLPEVGNALEFFNQPGQCFSYIGRQYGPQRVSIGTGCEVLGIVAHEIGHALGLYHEQARYDRDSFVSVMFNNIQPGQESQFTKQSRSSMTDYGVGYDYGSVMHYNAYSFPRSSYNPQETIQTLDANYQDTIGQRLGPSFMDVKRINFAYCNATCSTPLPCQNGGYTDPKSCSSCRCPTGFGGTLCDRAALTSGVCGNPDRNATDTPEVLQTNGAIECSYIITAPPGTTINFKVNTMSFAQVQPCEKNYLEIKYKSDLTHTGARFCRHYPTVSTSETNVLIILYKGIQGASFSMTFQTAGDGPIEVATTLQPSAVTSTTTESTTTSTAAPTSVPSTTPNTAPTTASTPFHPYFTRLPRTSTVRPPPTPVPCGSWSYCTGVCGGCGTQTRRCGSRIETRYCNFGACAGYFCCQPFSFSRNRGYCIRTSYDSVASSVDDSPLEVPVATIERTTTDVDDDERGSGENMPTF